MELSRVESGGLLLKSIHFCVEEIREPLLNGSKTQTIRCLMIPRYLPGENVAINWRRPGAPGEKSKDRRQDDTFLFFAQITEIYAKRLKEITEDEAVRDGIPNRTHLIAKLMEMHHLKSEEHFCFVIRFKRIDLPGVCYLIKKGKKKKETLDKFVKR